MIQMIPAHSATTLQSWKGREFVSLGPLQCALCGPFLKEFRKVITSAEFFKKIANF